MAKVKDATFEKVEEKEVKKTVKKTAEVKTVAKVKTSVKTADKKTPVKEVSETKVPKAKAAKKEVKATAKSVADKKVKNVSVEKTEGKKPTTKQNARSDKKRVKGSVIFVRPQAIKMERDENGKAIGLSMFGFQLPDGQYYKVNIPFASEDGKVTSKILTSEESVRFPGWGIITMEESAILTMTNSKGEEATLDMQAFKNFVVNKNHKIQEKMALKQSKAMENNSKVDNNKTHSGVADGR